MNLSEKVKKMAEQEGFQEYFFIATKEDGEDYIVAGCSGGIPELISACMVDSARDEGSVGFVNFLLAVAKGIESRLSPDTEGYKLH